MSQDKPVLTVAQIEEFRAVIVRGEPGPPEMLSDEVFEARANALCDIALIGLDRQRSGCDHIWFPGDEGCRKCGAPPPPRASAQTREQINEPPQAGRDALTAPSQEGHVAGPAAATPELPIPNARLAEDFGDPETLLNSRSWLQKAVEAKGAKIVGGGCGCGQADIDVVLEGCKFNISIRPI